jgi:hypothetical protein
VAMLGTFQESGSVRVRSPEGTLQGRLAQVFETLDRCPSLTYLIPFSTLNHTIFY